jgi:hypothetical protein
LASKVLRRSIIAPARDITMERRRLDAFQCR